MQTARKPSGAGSTSARCERRFQKPLDFGAGQPGGSVPNQRSISTAAKYLNPTATRQLVRLGALPRSATSAGAPARGAARGCRATEAGHTRATRPGQGRSAAVRCGRRYRGETREHGGPSTIPKLTVRVRHPPTELFAKSTAKGARGPYSRKVRQRPQHQPSIRRTSCDSHVLSDGRWRLGRDFASRRSESQFICDGSGLDNRGSNIRPSVDDASRRSPSPSGLPHGSTRKG